MGKKRPVTYHPEYYVQAHLSPGREDDERRKNLIIAWKRRFPCWADVMREMIDVYESHLDSEDTNISGISGQIDELRHEVAALRAALLVNPSVIPSNTTIYCENGNVTSDIDQEQWGL